MGMLFVTQYDILVRRLSMLGSTGSFSQNARGKPSVGFSKNVRDASCNGGRNTIQIS